MEDCTVFRQDPTPVLCYFPCLSHRPNSTSQHHQICRTFSEKSPGNQNWNGWAASKEGLCIDTQRGCFFFFWQSLVDCQPLLARIKGKASSGQNGWLFIWTFNGRKFWLALCGGAWVGGRFSVPLAARSPHFYTITWNHYFSGWGKLSIRLDSC